MDGRHLVGSAEKSEAALRLDFAETYAQAVVRYLNTGRPRDVCWRGGRFSVAEGLPTARNPDLVCRVGADWKLRLGRLGVPDSTTEPRYSSSKLQRAIVTKLMATGLAAAYACRAGALR